MKKPANDQAALAVALDVSPGTVSRYLKREDWPTRRRPPWSAADVERALSWRRGLQEDRAADARGGGAGLPLGVAQAVNVAAKNEQMLLARSKRENLQRQVVRRDVLDGAIRGWARMLNASLDQLAQSLPDQLAGLTAGEIERIVAQRIRAVRAELWAKTVIELQPDQAIAAAEKPAAQGRPSSRR